jgi:diguanylate cyclase (GGDEF)-like protein
MTIDRNHAGALVVGPVALGRALEQTHAVKARVESCADDLFSSNDIAKQKIADGAAPLAAIEVLANSERIHRIVQGCADDLHEVTETLAEGIGDTTNQTTIALAKSDKALAHTEAALATSQEEENKAKLRAMHDSMTGLPNRDLFNDRLGHAIAMAKRHDWTLAVMFLDLDGFKSINDTHGHAIGDAVLKEVARRLLEHSRAEDTVCRNGGDEFLYLLVNPLGSENIERIAGNVMKYIAQPIDLGSLQLIINASIGIAIYPGHGTTGQQLIRNADTAMYRAKQRTNRLCILNAVGA